MATVNWDPGYKKSLTIANAGTISDVLDLAGLGSHGKWAINFKTSALTGTVLLEVSNSATGTFVVQQSGGTDIEIKASKGTEVVDLTARFIRLVSGGAEGAERTFFLEGVRSNL